MNQIKVFIESVVVHIFVVPVMVAILVAAIIGDNLYKLFWFIVWPFYWHLYLKPLFMREYGYSFFKSFFVWGK